MDKKNTKVEIIKYNDIIKEKETKNIITKEDSIEIKRKIKKLLIGLIIFVVIFLTILIYMYTLKPNESTKKEENKTEEAKETSEEVLPDGDIEIENNTVEQYKNIITFEQYDTIFYPNIKNIFASESFSELDNNTKIYLASKTNTFASYLKDAGILEHEYNCNASGIIEIDSNVMKEAIEAALGPNTEYQNEDFIYPYYVNSTLMNVYDVNFKNGKYVIKCNKNYNKDLKTVIQTKINRINNKNNKLVFSIQAVFINKSGVYLDPNMTKLITNNKTATYKDYITKGNNYKFIFTKTNDKYYLSNIEQ